MKTHFLFGFLLSGAAALHGASCGTVGTPGACTLSVGGNLQYTFTGFSLITATGSTIYAGSDIGIDVTTPGGNSALLTFSKANRGTGFSFSADSGETTAFSFSYNVAVSALNPGTAALAAPTTVDIGLSSALNSGFGGVQMILTGGVGVSCQAILNSLGDTPAICNSLPTGVSNSMTLGNIIQLVAPAGSPASSVSINSFSNLFNASFTPGAETGTPEPSTLALLGMGLVALGWRRSRSKGVSGN